MKNYNRQGNTKYGGKPVLVCHSNVMQDLLDDSALLNNILVPGNENSPMKNGTLENYKAYGINFQETLICPVDEISKIELADVMATSAPSIIIGYKLSPTFTVFSGSSAACA